jgi:hypothetical protein
VRLELVPITRDEAFAFIERHHRHHPPPTSWRYGVGVHVEGTVVGVVVVGRPVSRHLDDGWTAEVTRLCTDGTEHAASKLYAAAWRASRALGYRRLITYTLTTEPGTSLRAAGWRTIGQTDTRARSWDRPGRPRVDRHAVAQRSLWAIGED